MKNKKNLGHLSPNQIHVTQEKGTEAPFTGELLYKKDAGIYTCVCCGNTLFSSDTKFDSGTGWPSFFDIENTDAVTVKVDNAIVMSLAVMFVLASSNSIISLLGLLFSYSLVGGHLKPSW